MIFDIFAIGEPVLLAIMAFEPPYTTGAEFALDGVPVGEGGGEALELIRHMGKRCGPTKAIASPSSWLGL